MRSIQYSRTKDKDPRWMPEWVYDPAVTVIKEEVAVIWNDTVNEVCVAYFSEEDAMYLMLKYDVEFLPSKNIYE